MFKVVVLVAVAVAAVTALPKSHSIGHFAQARDYPAPVYPPPPPPHRPPPKGKSKGKGFFNFDIFKGFKDLFSFGKGKGGREVSHSYGPPPPPRPAYGPPPKANYGPPPPPKGGYGAPPPPKGGYGAPPPPKGGYGAPPPPKGGYGAPPPPKGSYGAPPVAPSPSYGAPPVAPSPSYNAPVAPQSGYGAPKPGDIISSSSSGSYGPPPAPTNNYGPPPVPVPAPSGNYGPPPPAPSGNYGPPPPAPSGNYGAPPPAPTGNYGAPPPAPTGNYGAPPPAPTGNYGAPPPAPTGNYGAPPPAPTGNYGAPPPLPPTDNYGAPPPAPTGNYAAPPVPVAPLPVAPVPAPANNYAAPPPPPPPPSPVNYGAPTQPIAVPVGPPLPIETPAKPLPSKPDCEACDQAPWVPMEGAPVGPGPASYAPAGPAPVTNPPATVPISPPAPAFDVRGTIPDVPGTEEPIFLVEDTQTLAGRDPRMMEGPTVIPDDLVTLFDDPEPTTIIADDVTDEQPLLIVDEGEPEVTGLPLLPDVDLRLATDNSIVDTEAPVVETDAPVLETEASVLETEIPINLLVETETPAPVVETQAPVEAPVETEVPAPVLETEAPAPVLETEAPAPVLETEAPAPVETEAPAPVETVAPVEIPTTELRTNVVETEAPVQPTITQAVLQGTFGDTSFRLTDPEVTNVGQPQFIDSSQGTPSPAEVVSLSNPTVVGVGDQNVVSVSNPQIFSVQQPQPIVQESFTPVIVPNANQFSGPLNVVSVGQPQFVDQTFGQPQTGIPLSVSGPQLTSVSQPQVLSVSQPQIQFVSQPQFPAVQQQSQVTVTQPDGNNFAQQISISQSSPILSSQGGLQVVQAPQFESQIIDEGVSVVSSGSPLFVGISQGIPGNGQVVSVSNPQVSSVSNPQLVSVSQPQEFSVSQPDFISGGNDGGANIISLSPIFQSSDDQFSNIDSSNNAFRQDVGVPLPILSQSNVGGVTFSNPKTTFTSQPQISEFDFSQDNQPLTFGGDFGVPLPTSFSQGSVGESQSFSLSAPQVQGVSLPQTISISEPQTISVSQPQQQIFDFQPNSNVFQSQQTFDSHSSSQSLGGSVISAELVSSSSPNFDSFSGAGQNIFVNQVGPVELPPPQIINAELVSSSFPNTGSLSFPDQSNSFRQDEQIFSSPNQGGSVISAELVSYVPPDTGSFSGNQNQFGSFNQAPPSSIIQAEIISSSSPDFGTISGGSDQTVFSGQQNIIDNQGGYVNSFQNSEGSVIPAQFVGSSQDNNIFAGDVSGNVLTGHSSGNIDDNQFVSLSQPEIHSVSQPEVIQSVGGQDIFGVYGGNDQTTFVGQSTGNIGDGQVISISQPQIQSVSQPEIIQPNFGQDFTGVPLETSVAHLDNTGSQQHSFPSQINQLSSDPSAFVGESFGDVSNSQVLSVSEPQVISVSQPELLHSTFSSADNQDAVGISITSTSAQVKAPDMSSLPLADSSISSTLSSSSPAFPPFPSAQDFASEPLNTVEVPAQPEVVVQDAFSPSFQQTVREDIPQQGYLPPTNSASLNGVVDVRGSSQQVRASSSSSNIAKSLGESQTSNTVISQSTVSHSKNVDGLRLRPLPVRQNTVAENDNDQSFRPFSRDDSGFQYSAPGQRVQISFGVRPQRNRAELPSFGSSIGLNNENARPIRNTGRSLLNGAPGNSLLRRNTKQSVTENKDQSKQSTFNNLSSTTAKPKTTTTTPLPTTTTETSTTTTTTTTITTTTERPTTSTTPTPTTTKRDITTWKPFSTTTAAAAAVSITSTETPTTDTTTTKISTIRPGFRGRKRLRRPLSRRPFSSSTSSSLTDSDQLVSKQRQSSLLSIRNRGTRRHRPSVAVLLASDLKKGKPLQKVDTNDSQPLSNVGKVSEVKSNDTEEVVEKVVEQEETSTETPVVSNSEDSETDIAGDVDIRGSAKSISGGQSFGLPQRNNNFVFPKRRDPILPFGTRLSRPRPGSLFANPTAGPSPLTTTSTTLPVTQATTPLTNSLDLTRPFQPSQPEKPLITPVVEFPNNSPTDNAQLNQNPSILQLNMLPIVAPSNLPFIVAPVNMQLTNEANEPPTEPNEILLPPPSQSVLIQTQTPRLQRLFPSRQIPGTFTLHQNGDAFTSSSSSSSSSSSASSSTQEKFSSTSNIQFNNANGETLVNQEQSRHSSSNTSNQESDSSSFSFQSAFQSFGNNPTPSNLPKKENSRAKLFPTSAKPTSPRTSTTQLSGKSLLTGRQPNPPVLRRPLTPITRPLTRVVQTPVSEEYIKNFPEVAAPEGFPGEDPEEETIRSNIFELQRIS